MSAHDVSWHIILNEQEDQFWKPSLIHDLFGFSLPLPGSNIQLIQYSRLSVLEYDNQSLLITDPSDNITLYKLGRNLCPFFLDNSHLVIQKVVAGKDHILKVLLSFNMLESWTKF